MATTVRSAREQRATNRGKCGDTSPANFYGGDPSQNLGLLAKSPTKHRLAVMPQNIGKGTQGCYAGMQTFQEQVGVNPSDITLPTSDQLGAAVAVAEDVEKRADNAKEFYDAMSTVAKADAVVYKEWAKAQTTRMQMTQQQAESAASMAVAGFQSATKYGQMARHIVGEQRYHTAYTGTANNLFGRNMSAARVG